MRTPRTAPTRVAVLVRLRVATLAVAAVAVLTATVAPANAQATAEPTPQLVNDVLPARALPPVPPADAATFCPTPTGHWWEDVATHGCTELLAGRDHTTPVTDRELAWLDLGGLPAHATIDPDAIDTAIAAYEQRLADEAAAAEAARAAAEAAQQRRTSSNPPRPRVSQIRRVPTVEELDSMMRKCGLGPDYSGFIGEHPCVAALWEEIGRQEPDTAPPVQPDPGMDHESTVHVACLDRMDSMGLRGDEADFRAPEYEEFWRAMATCKDRDLPGYLARWEAGFPDHIRRREEAVESSIRAIERTRAFLRDLIEKHCPDGGSGMYIAETNRPTVYWWSCYDGTRFGPVYVD